MRDKIPFVLVLVHVSASWAISLPWRPIVGTSLVHQIPNAYGSTGGEGEEAILPQSHLLQPELNEQCALYKVAMNQQLYFEYIHYKVEVPDLKEFTLCAWKKFTNHSNDHPLFSYAVGDQARGILSWVANTARSSYYMMNIDGHTLYRLNYPLRLNKWYHSCQSWNGRTGEWQIWVNDERVGRGFNNRLVGHVIKGGGIAISGQEQRQLGGGFLEGEEAPKGSGGFLGEITMLQLYNVALTAGKAHKDHKHHHVHHYEHNTNNNVPPSTTQAPTTGRPLPMHPLLTGGQINHRVKINPGAHAQIVRKGVTLRHPLLPSPEGEILQPLPPATPQVLPPFSTSFRDPENAQQYFAEKRLPQFPLDISPINGFSFVDRRYRDLQRFKKIAKRDSDKSESADEKKVIFKDEEETKREKRRLLQLSDGSVVEDEAFLAQQIVDEDYFGGLANFAPEATTQKQEKVEEREPAEGEVRMVMDVCDGCADEPFEKALVFGWRSVPKKLYSGALHVPAQPQCKAF